MAPSRFSSEQTKTINRFDLHLHKANTLKDGLLYKRQISRLLRKSGDLRKALLLSFQYKESSRTSDIRHRIIGCVERLSSRFQEWGQTRSVDVLLSLPQVLDQLEQEIHLICDIVRKVGILHIDVSVPKSDIDRDSIYAIESTCNCLKEDVFVQQCLARKDAEVDRMMVLLQKALDATEHEDSRKTIFKLLSKLCDNCKRFASVPVVFVESYLGVIGSGMLGRVSKCVLADGRIAVIKTATSTPQEHKINRERLWRSHILLWQQLRHPYILPLWGTMEHSPNLEQIKMISPWCKNGNILNFLGQTSSESVNRLTLLVGVCTALDYLHNHVPSVVHGNLKAANVLIQDDGTPCLCDFGLSAVLCNRSTLSEGVKDSSLRWLSMERMVDAGDSQRPTRESDLWSLGMLILETLTGQPPWFGLSDTQVEVEVRAGRYPPRPTDLSAIRYGLDAELWDLVCQCWRKDPAHRPKLAGFHSNLNTLSQKWVFASLSPQPLRKAGIILPDGDLDSKKSRPLEPTPKISARGTENEAFISTPGCRVDQIEANGVCQTMELIKRDPHLPWIFDIRIDSKTARRVDLAKIHIIKESGVKNIRVAPDGHARISGIGSSIIEAERAIQEIARNVSLEETRQLQVAWKFKNQTIFDVRNEKWKSLVVSCGGPREAAVQRDILEIDEKLERIYLTGTPTFLDTIIPKIQLFVSEIDASSLRTITIPTKYQHAVYKSVEKQLLHSLGVTISPPLTSEKIVVSPPDEKSGPWRIIRRFDDFDQSMVQWTLRYTRNSALHPRLYLDEAERVINRAQREASKACSIGILTLPSTAILNHGIWKDENARKDLEKETNSQIQLENPDGSSGKSTSRAVIIIIGSTENVKEAKRRVLSSTQNDSDGLKL